MTELQLPKETKRDKVEAILSRVYNLPSLPAIISEVSKLVENPSSSASQLSALICKDQALSTKILSVANSPLYGFPRRVSTIDFAIVILGFTHIKNITIAFSIIERLSSFRNKYFNPREYWIHSLMTATAARKMAIDLGYQFSGEAFTAGLLHDLGIPVICKYFPEEFVKINRMVEEDSTSCYFAEEQVLGITHGEIGHKLIERWNLPSILGEVILNHHTPSLCTDYKALTAIIHLADYLTTLFASGSYALDVNTDFDREIISILRLGNEEYFHRFISSYEELFKQQYTSLSN
jgi:putative nucleotidyltransferase with HDIG domain